jgi:hypothetical protein
MLGSKKCTMVHWQHCTYQMNCQLNVIPNLTSVFSNHLILKFDRPHRRYIISWDDEQRWKKWWWKSKSESSCNSARKTTTTNYFWATTYKNQQLDQLPPKMQAYSLRATLGPAVIQTFQSFKQTSEEKADSAVIRQKYGSHFIPAINRTFERYTFNQTFMNSFWSWMLFPTSMISKSWVKPHIVKLFNN